MGKHTIIEINGKRYDALTGELLSVAGNPVPKQPASRVVHPTVNVPKPQPLTPKPIAVKTATASTSAKPKPKVRVHDAIKATKQVSHKPQPSKTLMRSAVKKPAHSLKRHAKARGHTDSLIEKPSATLKVKASVRKIDDRRLQRSRQISKHQAVSRFSRAAGPAPKPPTELSKPVAQPHPRPTHQPRHTAPAGKPRTTADLLERALQNAVSHEQIFTPAKKRRAPGKLASISMVAAALAILGGFVAYQNVTNVKLHLASSKAGFTASLPDYQPAGYHLSHLNSQPGEVAINFRSNTDNRAYAITEKASAWDSQALRDSFLASAGHSYQTVESGGRTLFLYGDNAATWVSGGVWYQVQSNGTLSNRQLIELAASM